MVCRKSRLARSLTCFRAPGFWVKVRLIVKPLLVEMASPLAAPLQVTPLMTESGKAVRAVTAWVHWEAPVWLTVMGAVV